MSRTVLSGMLAATAIAALSACNMSSTTPDASGSASAPADEGSPSAMNNPAGADPMASNDPQPGQPASAQDDKPRPEMQLQVVLERLSFGPGVIDGKTGLSTKNALRGFQQANGLTVSGEYDDATRQALQQYGNITATRVVTIPADFAQGPFFKVPKEPADQAKMPALGYESLDEKLAERFHTTVEVLKELNPRPAGQTTPTASDTASASPSASASGDTFTPQPGPAPYFSAGQQIRVPNVGADRIDAGSVDDATWLGTLTNLGVGTAQPKVSRVRVSKSKGTLEAYDDADKLVAVFTVTTGSSHDPLPIGDWKITAVSKNPPFHYNPDLFWDAKATDKKATLPPGPNGPVGVVWIDLTKEHYGIHGTPNPQTIGRTESHGCVRLTNWDAARLAQMVSTSTKVEFVK